MDLRTDRVGLLLDQLESSVEFSRDRLAGLTDAEHLWEPAPGAWSLRRRGQAAGSAPYGAGEWQMDRGADRDAPAPVTTIAWRLGHLISLYRDRWEWTYGSRSVAPELNTEFTPSAEEALAQLWEQTARWTAAVGATTDEQLDMVGFGQFPHGLDPQLPFVCILWWMNREFIHHAAEIALLRDLYRARTG